MHEFHLDRRMIDFFDEMAQRFQAKGVTLPAILATCGVIMFTCFGLLAVTGLAESNPQQQRMMVLLLGIGATGLVALCDGMKEHFRDALREFGVDEVKSYRTAAMRERAFEVGSRVVSLIVSGVMIVGGVYIWLADSLMGAAPDGSAMLFSGGFLGYAAWRYFRCAFPMLPPQREDERQLAYNKG